MKRCINVGVFLTIALLLALSIVPDNPLHSVNWALLSAIILCIGIIAFFAGMEKRGMPAKEVTLIATVAALAAVFRVPFAFIPSVQPTTFMVMVAGYVFGVRKGFMVGAIAALVSNFFLGQGPWTPWQMFCWGLSGVSAAFLGQGEESFRLLPFALLAGAWGFLFGWLMNIFYWAGFIYPLTLKTFLATYAASFPMDSLHGAGNIIFSIVFGKSFYSILQRFKEKMYCAKL